MNSNFVMQILCFGLLLALPLVAWFSWLGGHRSFRNGAECEALCALARASGFRDGSDTAALYQKKARADEKAAGTAGDAALLEVQYLKGRVDGIREEAAKLSVTFQPIIQDVGTWFKTTHNIGFDAQYFYGPVQIGNPVRHITETRQVAKDENIAKLFDIAKLAAEAFAASANGLPFKHSVIEGARHILKKAA